MCGGCGFCYQSFAFALFLSPLFALIEVLFLYPLHISLNFWSTPITSSPFLSFSSCFFCCYLGAGISACLRERVCLPAANHRCCGFFIAARGAG